MALRAEHAGPPATMKAGNGGAGKVAGVKPQAKKADPRSVIALADEIVRANQVERGWIAGARKEGGINPQHWMPWQHAALRCSQDPDHPVDLTTLTQKLMHDPHTRTLLAPAPTSEYYDSSFTLLLKRSLFEFLFQEDCGTSFQECVDVTDNLSFLLLDPSNLDEDNIQARLAETDTVNKPEALDIMKRVAAKLEPLDALTIDGDDAQIETVLTAVNPTDREDFKKTITQFKELFKAVRDTGNLIDKEIQGSPGDSTTFLQRFTKPDSVIEEGPDGQLQCVVGGFDGRVAGNFIELLSRAKGCVEGVLDAICARFGLGNFQNLMDQQQKAMGLEKKAVPPIVHPFPQYQLAQILEQGPAKLLGDKLAQIDRDLTEKESKALGQISALWAKAVDEGIVDSLMKEVQHSPAEDQAAAAPVEAPTFKRNVKSFLYSTFTPNNAFRHLHDALHGNRETSTNSAGVKTDRWWTRNGCEIGRETVPALDHLLGAIGSKPHMRDLPLPDVDESELTKADLKSWTLAVTGLLNRGAGMSRAVLHVEAEPHAHLPEVDIAKVSADDLVRQGFVPTDEQRFVKVNPDDSYRLGFDAQPASAVAVEKGRSSDIWGVDHFVNSVLLEQVETLQKIFTTHFWGGTTDASDPKNIGFFEKIACSKVSMMTGVDGSGDHPSLVSPWIASSNLYEEKYKLQVAANSSDEDKLETLNELNKLRKSGKPLFISIAMRQLLDNHPYFNQAA